MTIRVLVVSILAGAIISGAVVAGTPTDASFKRFDADRLASHELEMWQAYYAKERLHLFRTLVVSLREQFGYSWLDALRAAFHLARGAAWFGDARSGYEQVLPDLAAAYDLARARTSSTFDPNEVARAELAWWVARRTPGHDAPEQVGALIAEQYALFYGVPVARVSEAGRLRAEAAALRDRGGGGADWRAVGDILRRSYRSLRSAMD